MSSSHSKAASASNPSAFRPRIQLANIPVTLLILFGMWLCYEASSGRALPYPALLDPLKSVGLFLFRSEWMLRGVFWAAVVAHVYEAFLAARFATRVCAGRFDALFVLFWTLQTAAVGYPSLGLIKKQRRQQVQADKNGSARAAEANASIRDPRVRVATPADLDEVTALLIAFRDWWGSTNPSDATFRSTAARLLSDPNTEFLLGGERQGYAQIRFRLSAWTGTDDCWVEDVYVAEEARGSGLGKALTQAAIDRARARGCKRIELDVNEQNTHAFGLYTRLGFNAEPKPPGRTLFLGQKLV